MVACRAILHAKRKGHYEVLSVTRTATDDEIKRSYRKLALRFHVRTGMPSTMYAVACTAHSLLPSASFISAES